MRKKISRLFNRQPSRTRLPAERRRLGRWGERCCEKFLKKKGFKTLARNFTCHSGEIDLVMADDDGTVVFVEVKTRMAEDFTVAESTVNFAKKARLKRAGRYFLATHNIKERPFRFDVITVVSGQKRRLVINHYENAFVP